MGPSPGFALRHAVAQRIKASRANGKSCRDQEELRKQDRGLDVYSRTCTVCKVRLVDQRVR